MIELERHIEILLLSNDCVIVPGLGGFVAHHLDARYDKNDRMYLPPLRTLGFNPQLSMNDSLLVQSYSEANDISFPEAFRRVEDDVQAMKYQLQNEGYYILSGIGKLYINEGEHIEFCPCEAGILSPALYGLSSFEIAPLEMKIDNEIASTSARDNKKKKEMGARIISISTDSRTGQKSVNISMNVLRNMTIAAMIIAVFFLATSPISNNSKQLHTKQIKSGILYNIFNNNDNDSKRQITTIKSVAKSTKENVVKQIPTHYWTLVLCSHVGLKNANTYTDRLHVEGFKDACVLNGTNIKVIYGKYATEQAAYEAKRLLSDNENFKEAWVMELGK